MATETYEPHTRLTTASTRELLSRLAADLRELVQKEVALAKVELRGNLKSEATTAGGLGVAGLFLLFTLALLLTAAVLALSLVLPAWAAALITAGGCLLVAAVAGLIGWAKHVRTPLERTQKTLKEDMQWAKEQVRS
ncbi:MAG: phage holin family protein [Myxococcaceae bacterium]